MSEHPTAAWLSRQVTEAFPWDTAPVSAARLCASYGLDFRSRDEVIGSPHGTLIPVQQSLRGGYLP